MSKVFLLTKILLKSGAMSATGGEAKKKRGLFAKLGRGAMVVFVGVCVLIVMASFGLLAYGLVGALQAVNQESLFLGLCFLIVTFLILFTAIFSAINVYYFSKDINYLLPMPFKPQQIVLAKFNVLLLTEYLLEAAFLLPCLAVYGVMTGAGALFWVYSAVVFLALPVVPLIVCCLIVMVLMSFVNLTKYRDRFQLIAGLLGIAFAIGIQFVAAGFAEVESEQAILEMMGKANEMVGMFGKIFFTIPPAAEALAFASGLRGLGSLAVLLAETGAAVLIYTVAAKALYFRGALGNSENAPGRRVDMRREMKSVRTQGVYSAYVKKEWKLLLRNPIYMMQCVLPALLMPVLFLVIFLVNPAYKDLLALAEQIAIPQSTLYAIALGFIQFFLMMNYASITAISREGQAAVMAKTFPVPYTTQCLAKLTPGFVLNVVSGALGIAMFAWLLGFSPVMAAAAAVPSLLFMMFEGAAVLLIDLKKPRLDWDSEYAVVKRNIGFLYQFLINAIAIGAIVGGAFLFSGQSYLWFALALTLLFGLLLAGVALYYRSHAERLFDNVQ